MFAGILVHHARTAHHVPVRGRVTDELVHLAKTTLVQQVHDELELVHDFVIRHFRLVSGLHERFEPGNNKFRRTSAQNGLFTEQVCLGFLGEGGLDDAGTCSANAGGVRERQFQCVAGCVLVDRDQAGHPMPLLILAPHETAGTLGRYQHYIEIAARLDLPEVHSEAVSEQQRCAFGDVIYDGAVEAFLDHIGREKGNNGGVLHSFRGFHHGESVGLCLRPAGPIASQTHDHIEAAVLEIQRVSTPLAAIAQYRHLAICQARGVDIRF